jgi:hypothetical protein
MDINRSTKRFIAIESLAGGAAATKAAAAAGVSRITINRWLKDAGFSLAVKHRSSELVDELGKRIAGLTSLALDVLEDEMRQPGAHHSERIRAAAIVVQNFSSLREVTALEARIARLEQEVL